MKGDFGLRDDGQLSSFLPITASAEELPAGEVAGYLKKVEEMDELLGDILYRPDETRLGLLGSLNWSMVGWARIRCWYSRRRRIGGSWS